MTQPPVRPVACVGVEAAVAALDDIGIKGTRALLARRLGLTRAAVADWGNQIPLKRLPAVIRLTGLAPDVLRPTYREDFQRELGVPAEVFLDAATLKAVRPREKRPAARAA